MTLAAAAPEWARGNKSLPGQLAPNPFPPLRPAKDHQPTGEPDTATYTGGQPAGPTAGDP